MLFIFLSFQTLDKRDNVPQDAEGNFVSITFSSFICSYVYLYIIKGQASRPPGPLSWISKPLGLQDPQPDLQASRPQVVGPRLGSRPLGLASVPVLWHKLLCLYHCLELECKQYIESSHTFKGIYFFKIVFKSRKQVPEGTMMCPKFWVG